MIRFKHSSADAILFTVPSGVAPELIKKMNRLLSGDVDKIQLTASLEAKVLKRKSDVQEIPLILLMFNDGEMSTVNNQEMFIEEGTLVLKLEYDSYELIADFLQGYIDGDRFGPEITDISVKGWRREKPLELHLEK